MTHRCVCVVIVAGLAAALPAAVSAQQSSPWPDPPSIMREEPTTSQPPRARPAPAQSRTQRLRPTTEQPDLDEDEQLSPRQIGQPPQRSQAQPAPARPATQGATTRERPPAAAERPAPSSRAAAPAAAASAPGGRAVACSGVFAKNSSHLKLAMMYDSKNITFGEVPGPENSKLMGSVLFPSDPKRRLEVLWDDPGSRAGTQLIVINGQSTWSGPKGLKLGMPITALEKANGKPFRVKGFDKDNVAQVVDWQGGSLASLPGGCRVGVFLAPDPKAPPDSRAGITAEREFFSNDGGLREARPVIGEIMLGY
jgi:hypothetical protein